MLRVLVILVALTTMARADEDFAPKAKRLTTEALERYDSEIDSRNFLLRINDLLDDSLLTNAKNARVHVVEAKEDFDKDPGFHKLEDVKVATDRLQNAITAYRAEAKTNALKVAGGLALAVIVVFGGAIFAFVKRKARR